ncbi:hypothetical protein PAXRUDRAFT_158823, partial [Paxillus rubicundulus Ve08.2h10]
PCLATLCREYRLFLLDHSLHTSLFQVGKSVICGFLQFRMLLGTKSRDGRNIETSGRHNSMSNITRIKHGEDGVLLGG